MKFIVYGALLLGLFYQSHRVMVEWWKRDDYTYCYLVVPIVLYLLWEKRESLSKVISQSSWMGLFPFVLGIIFYWLGELGGEFYTMYVASWLILVGLCWLHLGWEKFKTIFFALFFVLTMFPPPNFIYQKISVSLKLISSQLGVTLMQWYGMSAYREGNIIDLGFTQLQVVDACSGLRYLIPLIVLGILLAYFFRAPLWKKAFLLLSSVPLSVFSNSLRIAMTGILYEIWGPKVAEGFFHGFSGWFIFMFSLVLLLGEMWLLKRVIPERKSSTVEKDNPAKIPVAGSGNILVKTGVRSFFQPQFVAAVVLLGVTLIISQSVEFREKIPISKTFRQFPLEIGEWQGKSGHMEQEFINALHFNDYVIIDYMNAAGKAVNFYVAYYESQRKGESIHSPSTCLPSSGWIFNEAGKVTLHFAAEGLADMPVNRAFIQKGGARQLSYFWFPMRGRVLTNAYEMKIFNFWDALTRQRTDGALVRVITPVFEYEKVEEADKRLQAFVKDVVPVLDEFLPK